MLIDRSLLLRLLVRLMRPVARFCVRHSLRLQDIIECAKVALVEAGRDHLATLDERVNISRVSLMTGVHRRDVMRLQADKFDFTYSKDLITKIIGQWQVDKRFTTKEGASRVLSVDGDDSEFAELVHSVSKDMNPTTVVFELERIQAISHTKSGIKLVVESYVPQGDPEGGFDILSRDADDLTKAVEKNVLEGLPVPHFHARTEFDNVRPVAIPELKRWFLKEGHQFHARAREFIGQFDQDVNPDPKFEDKGTKVMIGAFSFVEEGSKKDD